MVKNKANYAAQWHNKMRRTTETEGRPESQEVSQLGV